MTATESWDAWAMTDQGPSRNQRVLVVGGSGYVGSVFTSHLLEGGYAARVLDSHVWGNEQVLSPLADRHDLDIMVGDIRDRQLLSRAMDKVDAVVLLAGLVGDPITRKYPVEAHGVNVDGVREVIEATVAARVPRLIFASTCSNYGLRENDEPADEGAPLHPLSPYAEQKVAIEHLLMGRYFDVPTAVTILRFATAYGLSPRMRFDLTVSHFAKDAVELGHIDIYDADTWRPYCHVRDLACAMSTALRAPESLVRGEVFNVGRTTENYTKRELGAMIKKFRPQVTLNYREGGGDARNYRVSFEKIQQQLGFEPSYRVPEHLPRLLDALERHLVASTNNSLPQLGNYSLPVASTSEESSV